MPLVGPMIVQMLSQHLRNMVQREMVGAAERALRPAARARATRRSPSPTSSASRAWARRSRPRTSAAVAERLFSITREVVEPPVRLVKTIGDAVLLTAAEPDALVADRAGAGRRQRRRGRAAQRVPAGARRPRLRPDGRPRRRRLRPRGQPRQPRHDDRPRRQRARHARRPRRGARRASPGPRRDARRIKGLPEPVPLYRARPLPRQVSDRSARSSSATAAGDADTLIRVSVAWMPDRVGDRPGDEHPDRHHPRAGRVVVGRHARESPSGMCSCSDVSQSVKNALTPIAAKNSTPRSATIGSPLPMITAWQEASAKRDGRGAQREPRAPAQQQDVGDDRARAERGGDDRPRRRAVELVAPSAPARARRSRAARPRGRRPSPAGTSRPTCARAPRASRRAGRRRTAPGRRARTIARAQARAGSATETANVPASTSSAPPSPTVATSDAAERRPDDRAGRERHPAQRVGRLEVVRLADRLRHQAAEGRREERVGRAEDGGQRREVPDLRVAGDAAAAPAVAWAASRTASEAIRIRLRSTGRRRTPPTSPSRMNGTKPGRGDDPDVGRRCRRSTAPRTAGRSA